jgi:hypothetical protein
MRDSILVRPIERPDYAGWRPLWDGYNAFYGRVGETALAESITAATWERFFTAQGVGRKVSASSTPAYNQ